MNGIGQLGTWVGICRHECKWSAMLSLMSRIGYRTTVISHLSLYQSFLTTGISQIIFEQKKLIMVNKVWAVLKNGKCKFIKNENNENETQNEFSWKKTIEFNLLLSVNNRYETKKHWIRKLSLYTGDTGWYFKPALI